jgi:CBS domain-containing protein
MAVFLGSKGDILAWRGTSELVSGIKESLARQMAELSTEEDLALLQKLQELLAGELRYENEFSAAFDKTFEELNTVEYHDQLPELHARFNGLAADYFQRRGSVIALISLCNTYRDALVRKALDLVEIGMRRDDLGLPPAPFGLLAAGVAGREEQTLVVASDYFLVHGDRGTPASDYFRQFGYRVMAVLDSCGLLGSRRRKKPTDTLWHGSLDEWQSWVSGELQPEKATEPELLALPALTTPLKMLAWRLEDRHRMLARLADLRSIRSDELLASQMSGIVRDVLATERQSEVQVQLSKKIAEMPVALGFFRGLRTERRGEQKGKINIELYAIAPLTMSIRMLAINHGIEKTGTIDRIKALLNGGHLNVELADRLLKAYQEFFTQKIRLEMGTGGKGKGSLYLDPETLSPEDEQRLKNGLEAVVNLQKIVYLRSMGQG